MIRREGHDPLQYTISRRGKKMPAGSHQQSSAVGSRSNQNWDSLAGMSAPKRSRDHDYEDPAGLMYRLVTINIFLLLYTDRQNFFFLFVNKMFCASFYFLFLFLEAKKIVQMIMRAVLIARRNVHRRNGRA